jgi:protein gp37
MRGTSAFPKGFDLTLRPHKLVEPYRLKKPSLIFVNSMSDLFWEAIPDDYRDRVLDVIEDTPQHQYQVLTKRPEKMLEYSHRRKLPPNFWAGVTIECNRHVGRADILRAVDAEIRFVSAEPLLDDLSALELSGIHWLISGGGVRAASA